MNTPTLWTPLLLTALLTGQEPEPPTVLSLEPAHLAVGVDAAKTTSVVVRFDREMDTKLHAVCGGGQSFPTVRNTYWVDDKTFAIDVTLQPDHV